MRTTFGTALFLGLAACMYASSPVVAGDGTEHRTIAVSGHGEVSVSADRAILSFAVETSAKKATEAAAENAAKSGNVVRRIKERLDAADRVQTVRYSLDPRYERPERGKVQRPRIIGYVAQNEVRVQTHDLKGVGGLVDAAIEAGANRISNLQFTLKKRDSYLRQALAEAGAQARAEAESIAAALGVKLKQVLSASTSSGPVVLPKRQPYMRAAAVAARPPTPMEPGAVTVAATLYVTYEIE